MKTIYTKETKFGKLEVVDVGCERRLLVDGACQGRMDLHTDRPLSEYMLRMLLAIRAPRMTPESVLVLGGGAYLIPKELLRRGYYVEVVEQNEDCFPLAVDYFRFKTDEYYFNNHAIDANAFCFEERVRFGSIVLDLYNGYDGGEFYTPKYITKLRKHCKQLLVNRIVDGKNKVEEYEGL